MDKDTKIELLKILGMIIILVLLIWGIVWLNSEDTEVNETNTSTSESSEDSETGTDDTESSENSEDSENGTDDTESSESSEDSETGTDNIN